jgi:hypothetical protein
MTPLGDRSPDGFRELLNGRDVQLALDLDDQPALAIDRCGADLEVHPALLS